MAIRLKKVMPCLIGETQSTFLMEGQILDGALIANEVVQWARKNKKEIALLKLDFQKAYDTVKWSFIDQLLDIMGFGVKWRGWIGQCLSTTSISILVNGSPTVPFKMERGLRQGDPLSPFLFILATEAFKQMMRTTIEKRIIRRMLDCFQVLPGIKINIHKSGQIALGKDRA